MKPETRAKLYTLIKEAKEKWIQGAVGKPGHFHRLLGVPKGQKIPPEKLEIKPSDSTKIKRVKVLVKNLQKIAKKRKKAKEGVEVAEQKIDIARKVIGRAGHIYRTIGTSAEKKAVKKIKSKAKESEKLKRAKEVLQKVKKIT